MGVSKIPISLLPFHVSLFLLRMNCSRQRAWGAHFHAEGQDGSFHLEPIIINQLDANEHANHSFGKKPIIDERRKVSEVLISKYVANPEVEQILSPKIQKIWPSSFSV